MYLPARRTHPADIAGPVAAAAAAPSSASAAVPSRQRQHDVAPTDSEQPVNNVDAGEEEDLHELALKRRRASSAKLSDEAGTTAKAAPAAAAAAAVLIKSRSGRAVTLPKWMKGDGAFATGKVLNNVFHQQEAARAFDSDQAVDDVDSGEDVVHERDDPAGRAPAATPRGPARRQLPRAAGTRAAASRAATGYLPQASLLPAAGA